MSEGLQEDDMGQYYSQRSHQSAPTSLKDGGHWQNKDLSRLMETQSLQQKLQFESQKIIQVNAQFNSDMQAKEKLYNEATETCLKQRDQMLELQNNNEHLLLELQKELTSREALVEKMKNSREIWEALVTHYQKVEVNLNNNVQARESTSAQFLALNARADQLMADYEALKNRYNTERKYLRQLVTDERESRVNEIHVSNKQKQELEMQLNESLQHLHDEQNKNISLMKAAELSTDQIKQMRRASENLVKDHLIEMTNLANALNHAKLENNNLEEIVRSCRHFEEEYNKLTPEYANLEKERYEILKRLASTESLLTTREKEKEDAIEKLGVADDLINKKETERSEISAQLEKYQSSMKSIQVKNEMLLGELETANSAIVRFETERDESHRQLALAELSMNNIVREKFEVLQQLDNAKSSISDVTSEKFCLQKQLQAAEDLIKSINLDKEDICDLLKKAETSIQEIDSEKSALSKSLELTELMIKTTEDEKHVIQQNLEVAEEAIKKSNVEKEEILEKLATDQSALLYIKKDQEDIKNKLSSAELLIATKEQEIRDTLQKLEAALTEIKDLEKNQTAVNDMLGTVQSASDKYKTNNENILLELREAESELEEKALENSIMTEQLLKAASQIVDLKEEKEETMRKLESSECTTEASKNDKTNSLRLLENMKSSLQKMEVVKSELNRELELAGKSLDEKTRENDALVQELAAFTDELKLREELIVSKQDELDDFKIEAADVQQTTNEWIRENMEKESEEIVDLKKKLEDAYQHNEQAAKTMQDELKALRETNVALQGDKEAALEEKTEFQQRVKDAEEANSTNPSNLKLKLKLQAVKAALKKEEVAKMEAIEKQSTAELKMKLLKSSTQEDKQKVTVMMQESERQKVEFGKAMKEFQSSRQELQAMQNAVKQLTDEKKALESKTKELKEQVENQSIKKAKDRKYIHKRTGQIMQDMEHLKHQLNQAKAKLKTYEMKEQNCESALASPRSYLKSDIKYNASSAASNVSGFETVEISSGSSASLTSDLVTKKRPTSAMSPHSPPTKLHKHGSPKRGSVANQKSPRVNPTAGKMSNKKPEQKVQATARSAGSRKKIQEDDDPFAFT